MQAMQDKIKVVIVDDEPQSIHKLQDDLATLVDFEVIATSSSAVSAKNLVMSMQPDVLFLDVEMPGADGLGSIAVFERRNADGTYRSVLQRLR